MVVRSKRRREYKDLKSRISGLEADLLSSDPNLLIGPDEARNIQRDTLTFMRGLPDTPLTRNACQTVEQLNFSPLQAGAGPSLINRWAQNLGELERQLDLVFGHFVRRRRVKHRPKADFRLPPTEANSKGRAGTVARIIERLRPFKATSDGQDYQRLQKHDADLVATLEKVWTRPKLEAELTKCHSDRAKKQMAMSFAADYHEKELSTIQTDWKDHKPKKHRRRH